MASHSGSDRRKNSLVLIARASLLLLAIFCVIIPATAQAPANTPANAPAPAPAQNCKRTISASVVALDQVVTINRLGTMRPGGMIYALERDVVSMDGSANLKAGQVMLRKSKRPRPIVLRMNVGDCLEIKFRNLLKPENSNPPPDPLQPVTRNASIHVAGLELVNSIADQGIFVGANPNKESGLLPPGDNTSLTYKLYAPNEGAFLLYSSAADYNGFGTTQLTMGMFGAVNVEPAQAEYYRSQVTNEDLQLATKKTRDGRAVISPDGHPVLDYDALYPSDYDAKHPGVKNRSCTPILKMVDIQYAADSSGQCQPVANSGLQVYHSDLTAIITGPKAGRFAYPEVGANFTANPSAPDRRQPFREVTIHYHESQDVVQPFPVFYDTNTDPTTKTSMFSTLQTGQDGFAINYGVAGIGAEILANRYGVGPMGSCTECKFEEFFLSSWVVGDPAMVVDKPANLTIDSLQNASQPCLTSKDQYSSILEGDAVSGGQPFTDCSFTKGVFDPNTKKMTPVKKATKAFFPDDPSNVYHSYLGDHVKFQILHAGTAVHHVHHHHAHQWLHSPNSDDGHYLDSQAIGPGSSFTLDLVYNGSGNRNLTVGDSIFHCHFYPHFAAGMWAMFRVHDVFEAGTSLDNDGRPAPGSRALPDGEIAVGTPIPAIVPMPTIAMAPIPAPVQIVNGQVQVVGEGNPGFPFFVPGIAGHRPPHPPMDFAIEDGETLDGGLPRHIVTGGTIENEKHTTLDFSKDMVVRTSKTAVSGTITALQIPEQGTDTEKQAMAAHARRAHPTFLPDGKPGNFIMNGLPPAPGAPFADPGVDDNGNAIGKLRRYKGANIQVDAVFNKDGWHFPQQRMMALWGDVHDTINGTKPPEPLFFRANTGEVVEYWHTNLVPAYYELDDFQVRTPTDILGQHIHLVKFDVTSSDGAANGFNYEDGTFSPDEVRDRISGINNAGGLWSFDGKGQAKLKPKGIKALGDGPAKGSGDWLGAQATIQRWYADPLLDNKGHDRTITTVFTHDHFGPSTHQMVGLYGGLLVEPENSKWTSLDGKTIFGSRFDGGPTSYAANIITANPEDSYREFALEWQDTQFVYLPTSKTKPDCYPGQFPPDCVPAQTYLGWADPKNALNCPNCAPTPAPSPPQPSLIGDFAMGMFSMNYRNEPLPLRVTPPVTGPSGIAPVFEKDAMDLSHAFRSIKRNNPRFNIQPAGGSPIDPARPAGFIFPKRAIADGMLAYDPYTPLLRAYQNDKVQVRLLTGAHTSMHNFSLHGVNWLFEPHNRNSGYRSSQFAILSEHFELHFTMPPTESRCAPGAIVCAKAEDCPCSYADYLYNPSSSYEGLVNGTWGLLRAYNGKDGLISDLQPLPNNPTGSAPAGSIVGIPQNLPKCHTKEGEGVPCLREFNVSAFTIGQLLGKDAQGNDLPLIYNSRGVTNVKNPSSSNPTYFIDPTVVISDPDALIYVRDDDLEPGTNKLKPSAPIEPLILRAAAGDWIKMTVRNRFNADDPLFKKPQAATKPTVPYSNPYSNINLFASTSVGLHPTLLSYDITRSDGSNVGMNPIQTISPKDAETCQTGTVSYPCKTYVWYAGNLAPRKEGGPLVATPVEFGAVNLMPSDPLTHNYKGLFGGLIIEPQNSRWIEDTNSRASATVFKKDGSVFRDFALIAQDDIGLQINSKSNGQLSFYASGNPISAFNYKTEPMVYRFGARMPNISTNWADLTMAQLTAAGNFAWTTLNTHKSVSNELVLADPQTPIFSAPAGMPVRFRLLYTGGTGDNQQVFELSGHAWQEEPFINDSTEIGNNPRSQWRGATTGYGPTSSYDIVLEQAGGRNKVSGDYLYRSWPANQFQAGLWGLFRVAPAGKDGKFPDTVTIISVTETSKAGAPAAFAVTGVNTVSPQTGKFASSVSLFYKQGANEQEGKATVKDHGNWTYEGSGPIPETITVRSEDGGIAVYRSYKFAEPTVKGKPEKVKSEKGKTLTAVKPAAAPKTRTHQPGRGRRRITDSN